MNKLLPVLWAAAAIFLSSCWHPPFDPLVSASEFTADKLGAPVWSRTVTLMGDAAGGYYLPSRDPAYYGTGMWIKKSGNSIRTGVFSPSTSTGLSFTFSTYNEFGDSATILSPLFLPAMTVSKVLIGANVNIDNGGIVTYNGTAYAVFTPGIQDVVGFGTAPINGATDSLAIMTWPTGDAYPTIRSDVFNNTSPLLTPGNYPLSLDPPPRPTGRVFTAYCVSDSYLYASYPAGGTMVTYRWQYYGNATPLLAPVLIPIHHKLTGILSDGRLLADTGDELYVYSADGTDSFSIPTGILRFVHEYTPDSINWFSVFTRTVQIPGGKNDDGSEYLIEIYEIPTADLRDLSD